MLVVLSQFLKSTLFKNLSAAVVILVIGVLIIRVLMRLIEASLNKSRLEKAAHSLILSLSKAAMYILLFLIAASTLGIDVSSIVALASVLTLAFPCPCKIWCRISSAALPFCTPTPSTPATMWKLRGRRAPSGKST